MYYCFNLVIEVLLISSDTAVAVLAGQSVFSFNLVIEVLLISSHKSSLNP